MYVSMGMINLSKFRLPIGLAEKEYKLAGLVKHLGLHFTSAVHTQYNSSFFYLDNLKDSCVNYFLLVNCKSICDEMLSLHLIIEKKMYANKM